MKFVTIVSFPGRFGPAKMTLRNEALTMVEGIAKAEAEAAGILGHTNFDTQECHLLKLKDPANHGRND